MSKLGEANEGREVKDYLKGLIQEEMNRGQSLKAMIPRPLKYSELEGLAVDCETKIEATLGLLQDIAGELEDRGDGDIRDLHRKLRQCHRYLALLESFGVTALYCGTPEIGYLTKLVYKVHQEINFPVSPPSVACISTEYYYYHAVTNVIFVPLTESDYLLHIPDLFHEMGHAVFDRREEPRLEQSNKAYLEILQTITQHYHTLLKQKRRETGPRMYPDLIRHLYQQWLNWIVEFFCDLFALYTLGPAYAWAHLHLSSKTSDDVYRLPFPEWEEHPSDEARMRMLRFGLEFQGFGTDAKAIEAKWNGMPFTHVSRPSRDYHYAYPDDLLKKVAGTVFEGLKRNRFNVVDAQRLSQLGEDSIVHLLNEAWDHFWQDPCSFRKWEQGQVGELKARLGVMDALHTPSNS